MKELTDNGSPISLAEAIEKIRQESGKAFRLEKINLAELERLTGISRSKLRTLQKNGFENKEKTHKGTRHKTTKLTGYTGRIDALLKSGVSNSVVILSLLKDEGFEGGNTIVKEYIAAHKDLLPAKRQQVDPQGNRGRRYSSEPGESYQMDWGFTDVLNADGNVSQAACFAMICHHCGERYIEFFPNAAQENLFIGMIHAFRYMGIPKSVLTDNMKSVVIRRDACGQPLWQKDYEGFMKEIGFETTLCKPRHPYTKGAVERLVRFVKENFLAGRTFHNMTDLNRQALEWCHAQNNLYHKAVDGVPEILHTKRCGNNLAPLTESDAVRCYLCPERRISFDGFVSYEGRRYGVPYSYSGKTARVMRDGNTLCIYSADLKIVLAKHPVTWERTDSFCEHQYEEVSQPEEHPTMPVKTQIRQVTEPKYGLSFEKFNFDEEDDV